MSTGSGSGALQVAICVPARNEAAALPVFLAAINRLVLDDVAPQLCLLLDSCSDASIDVVQAYLDRAALPTSVRQARYSDANAGRARHQAMLLGEEVLDGAGLLLTTDADSQPAPDWLQAMTAASADADLVTGRVVRTVTRSSPTQDRLERYYDALYALRRDLDPVPWEDCRTHSFSSATNMGVSVDSYRALGGFKPLASGEDARLVDDAGRAGLRVRRDAASVVHTSDRRLGRVAQGLAGTLRVLDHGDGAIQVAHPQDAAWQYCRHADARVAFEAGAFTTLAPALGLTIDHAIGVARDCPNSEAFAMRVVPEPPGGMRHVSLAVAEVELAALSVGRRAA